MHTSDDSNEKLQPRPASLGAIDAVIWAIIALQILAAIYGFVVLPDRVPIHWGIDGRVNGYGPKWVGTFLYPLLTIGIYLLVRTLLVAGPRLGGREDTRANLQIAKVVLAGPTVLLLIIQLATLAYIQGIHFDVTMITTLGISILLIFLGNYMGKIRRNFWMGIRTPWTLTNAVVWERTHRLGGWLFVAVGLLGIPCSFIPMLRLWGVVIPAIIVSLFLTLYSYICYQHQIREGHEPLTQPFDEESS